MRCIFMNKNKFSPEIIGKALENHGERADN